MSKDECKQRFKGVENFLRRVAFNLGNTPSQTEVKVISCIPIDVSDLQQKINELEKQLEAVNCKVVSKSQIEINTAICSTSIPKICNVPNTCKTVSCHQSNASLPCPNLCENSKSSNIYSTCPAGPCQTQDCFSTDATEMSCSKKRKQNECRKKFFTKKTVPKAKKMRTQYVYYAETENRNPFNRHRLPDAGTSKNGSEDSKAFERSYVRLSNMVRKQYRPGAVNVDFGMSEYSSPICRDFICAQNVSNHQPQESDMCSCCHGPFRNIDDHMKKQNHYDIYSSQTESNNTYYDSKFYDVIPVKENSDKIKNIEHPKRRETKQLNKYPIDTAFWPGYKRPRYRDKPIIVNYNTTGPVRQHTTKNPVKLINKREKFHNSKYKKPVVSAPVNRHVRAKVSKTRSVEVSEVYTRKLEKGRRKTSLKRTPITVTNQNDSGCLTTIIASTECQTTSGTNAQKQTITNATESEDRTKVTLNQIKDILQSVLTEVKINSKIGNTCGQAKKKDAIVQNGLSQNYMFGGSSLLQSFSYSPYEIDPYGPSCSQQIQTGSLCYPNLPHVPAKCMQNYPLIVQPRRNMCASCYNPTRNNPHKLPNMRRAASTATNTEELQGRSKETEILIREIYKAMALNIDISEKTPVKEQGFMNKTTHSHNIKSEDRETSIAVNEISELFKNANPIETSVTQNTGTPFDSKLASNETSFRCHPGRNSERDINSKYDNNEVRSKYDAEQAKRPPESDEESDTTIVNEEGTELESASDIETEYDEDNVVLAIEEPIKKKEKGGLLNKMLKIFRPRSRNRKYKSKSQPRDSESVDYQIIHGNKASPMPTLKPITSQTRAVIYYSKKPKKLNPEHSRKTPYMEQEYRRYFDEQLMFHDTQNPKSSTVESDARKKPIFYQKIEARSALVDYDQDRILRSTNQHTANQNQEENSRSKSPSPERASVVPAKAQRWLERHKLQCGKRWKKLILES